MSLVENAMETCILQNQTTADDGYGGTPTTYTSGESFEAAIVFDNSIEARAAAVEGVTDRYTVYTHRDRILNFHDVFKRKSNGMYLRVTSNGSDKATPVSAALDLRVVTAEEYEVSTNG